MLYDPTERAVAVFDYAMLRPEGFFPGKAASEIGITLAQFHRAVRDIRRAGVEYGWTVACEPPGGPGEWLYKLAHIYNEGREWVGIRADDVAARLQTLEDALAVFAAHTDGRTTEGRTAKRALRRVRYLREEMQDVEAS